MVEEMGESVFNLQVPLQLLHCFIAADQQRLKDIQALGYVRAHSCTATTVFEPLPSPPLPSPSSAGQGLEQDH